MFEIDSEKLKSMAIKNTSEILNTTMFNVEIAINMECEEVEKIYKKQLSIKTAEAIEKLCLNKCKVCYELAS